MKSHLAVALCFLLLCSASAQKGIVSGSISDVLENEPIPFASIQYSATEGVLSDPDGRFSFELPYGDYIITASAVGYEKKSLNITIDKSRIDLEFSLISLELAEVVIVSDYAIGRETPVAYSNIPMKRIEEELASRDMAAIVNTVPGAYATQQGGGDGDARVTIRGFSQNNVAVMLDGVPMNDMENGWVYWSNWFGLDAVLQTTQVQRGLGASKLAIPAIGGTINIITRGIEQKSRLQIKQETGDNGFLRSTIGFNSGKLNKGWGFALAGSWKKGDGWVDGTWTKGFFYYAKLEKIAGNHILGISAFGAPQSHGQRSFRESLLVYDRDYAEELGINVNEVAASLGIEADQIPEYGLKYNSHVGTLTRYDLRNGNREGMTTEELNERVNYYHKPQFSLKDTWRMNEESFLSTTLYMSLGRGGGTRLDAVPDRFFEDGSVNYQDVYDEQTGYSFEPSPFFPTDPSIDTTISATEHKVMQNYIKSAVNNHFWYGVLSTYNQNFGKRLKWSLGIDARRYRGEHYAEITDLLGADYIDKQTRYNPNEPSTVQREGDIIDYHDEAFVQWGGLFTELEWKTKNWTGFVSSSVSRTGYRRINYFLPKVIDVGDEEIAVGYHADGDHILTPDSVEYNGTVYTPLSPGTHYQETDWYYRNGFVVKAGLNRKFNNALNAYANVGYFTKAPLMSSIYDFQNKLFQNIVNERITGIEGGLIFKRSKIAANLNAYFTTWENRPYPNGFSVPDPDDPTQTIRVNIPGMDARHVGIEYDMAINLFKGLTWEALVSAGDWIWNSADTIPVFYDDGTPAIDPNDNTQEIVEFDAKGVHVGNAAQLQLGTMLRYEWKNGAYLKARYTRFDRQFAEFDPNTLKGDNAGRESWRTPGYSLMELHAGYSFQWIKIKTDIRASVLNLLDVVYISDAQNNDIDATYTSRMNTFDAASAGVFVGQGRRFNISMTFTY